MGKKKVTAYTWKPARGYAEYLYMTETKHIGGVYLDGYYYRLPADKVAGFIAEVRK